MHTGVGAGSGGGGGLNFSRVHGFTYVSHYTGPRLSRRLGGYTSGHGLRTRILATFANVAPFLFSRRPLVYSCLPDALTLDVLVRCRLLARSLAHLDRNSRALLLYRCWLLAIHRSTLVHVCVWHAYVYLCGCVCGCRCAYYARALLKGCIVLPLHAILDAPY